MSSQPTISIPTLEQHPTDFGIGNANPRISWRFCSDSEYPPGWEQYAYDIEVFRGPEIRAVYHNYSAESVLVPWPDCPLASRERVRLRVRSYGQTVNDETSTIHDLGPTSWSPWVDVECGLLNRDDWLATPITTSVRPVSDKDGPLRPLRFRRSFAIPFQQKVQQARLFITSFGVYEAYIDGKMVGAEFMAPGWTSYHHRQNYQIYDIMSYLQNGVKDMHTIAVEVAEGWYATRLGFNGGNRYIYGGDIGVIVQLEVMSESGEVFFLASDETWICRPSAIIRSEIYDGEVYDAREEQPDWSKAAVAEDDGWVPAKALPWPRGELVSPNAPPVRVTEEVKPSKIITTPSGKIILDFGQNLVGRLKIRALHKPRDHTVKFIHAEVLDRGELGTRPLRVAKCTDTIISAGAEIRNWLPHYTFHGFRYVQVEGWTTTDEPCPLSLEGVLAEVLHTDLTRTGWFSCSHPMVNRLHENARWGMRGNFLSVPTDCPQRDERLGWTGDLQVFCSSASFLYNTAGMLGDWLQDLSAEQLVHQQGIPPLTVPNIIPEETWPTFAQAVWDDVTVLTPWVLYQSYGDIQILRKQYCSMTAWIDQGVKRGPDRLWDGTHFQLGDWLDPTAPPDHPGDSRTDGTIVADAYLVYTTGIIASISQILGEDAHATRYSNDYEQLRDLFEEKYISKAGLIVADTQTALSLAIVFELYRSPEQRAIAGARLARSVRLSKFKVSTGFAGTPVIAHALTATGSHQLAYRMLLEKECPSWMYPVTMGATTIWERWNSMLPDGSINPGEMTSFNHYALGSIINWLHTTVAGIAPLEPGWKKIKINPIPGGTITSAEARYETPYGLLQSRWSITDNDLFSMEVLVPPNSKALVLLPGADPTSQHWIGAGWHTFSSKFDSNVGWPPKALGLPLQVEDTFV